MLILPGVVMCWLDRFVCRWKCTDEALMIRLASKVGGCREFGPEDAVVNRQPDKHGAIADGIERSPPQTRDYFKRRVPDFADDLRWA